MAKKPSGRSKPGKSVTRKVSRGPNKGDTVQFRANKARTAHPGKLVPRRVVKDAGKTNRTILPKGKKKS